MAIAVLARDRAGVSHMAGPLVAVEVPKFVNLVRIVIPARVGNVGQRRHGVELSGFEGGFKLCHLLHHAFSSLSSFRAGRMPRLRRCGKGRLLLRLCRDGTGQRASLPVSPSSKRPVGTMSAYRFVTTCKGGGRLDSRQSLDPGLYYPGLD